MNKSELIATRSAVPEDLNFILATWLRGLYYSDTWYSEIPKNIFMANYHAIIEGIISLAKTKIDVACLKEDPNVILGYVIYDENALHWVFIKKNWRNIGIAKDLVPSSLKAATHATKVGLSIMKKKAWIFNPFLIGR